MSACQADTSPTGGVFCNLSSIAIAWRHRQDLVFHLCPTCHARMASHVARTVHQRTAHSQRVARFLWAIHTPDAGHLGA